MTELQAQTAAETVAACVREDRAAGLAKTWRSVTVLLDEFRKSRLTDEERVEITEQLWAAGVTVHPPLADCDRHSKVRLLLRTESIAVEQDLIALGLVQAWHWPTGSAPVPLQMNALQETPVGGVLLIDVHPAAEVIPTLALLAPLLPGLTESAVADLLQVDDLPAAEVHADVRKLSTVGVYAVEDERHPAAETASKAGQLVFQVVELLVAASWVVTCWHEPRGTRAKSPPDGLDAPRRRALESAGQCWRDWGLSTPGGVGLMLCRELARSYLEARRSMHSWLEQWELEFHRSAAATEQHTLRELGVMAAEFQRRLTALDETVQLMTADRWFPAPAEIAATEQLETLLERSSIDLLALSASLRSSVELLTTAGIREHLRLAEVAGRKADSLQDQFGRVASILLVPTFIAGLFGANTQIPGQGHWSGFVGMLVLMIAGAVVTLMSFRLVQRRAMAQPEERATPPGRVRRRSLR